MNLPIAAVLPALQQALADRHEVVLEAPPGAGKTTLVPLALLDAPWLAGQKILMLEPRRLAAKNAAHRMASLLGEHVGQTVGYRMRLESKVSGSTRIEVITEGILTRLLQHDPALDGVGLAIFDEFHERSLDADLALSLCLHGRDLFRATDNPLKLLVMSATLDAAPIAALLDNAPIIRSAGRSYPVDIRYGQAARPGERIATRTVAALQAALQAHPGSSILAFLPGQGEIKQVAQGLTDWLRSRQQRDVEVHPLHGQLGLEEQQRAIAPAPAGQRKVVLATNLAETSLTIEGVDVVVDAGLVREARFDPNTGMDSLHTVRISRAASTQRAGRAGRLAPGVCYRLWSAAQQEQLAAHPTPEILRADLAPLALQLLAWGVTDPAELRWLDAPPAAMWQQALDLLEALGALARSPALRLTPHGQQLAALPLHPRLAHLLLCGATLGQTRTAAALAAILAERHPASQADPDLSHAVEILNGTAPCPAPYQAWLHRTRQLAQQYQASLHPLRLQSPAVTPPLSSQQVLGYLVACAYPERIARRRHSGGYQLANGRSATLPAACPLATAPWLAVAEVSSHAGSSSDTIRTAAVLDPALFAGLLRAHVQEHTVLAWDDKAGRFVAETQRKVGALVLERKPLAQVPTAAKTQALLGLIRQQGLALLPWQAEHTQWCARVSLLQRLEPQQGWYDTSMANLLATLEHWLAPHLGEVNSLTDFKQLDLGNILRGLLPWELQQRLEQLAPSRILVPSGRAVAVDYTHDPPLLAVKLQEMFGCTSTPSVANGKVKLLLHLLSPAGRPLQVTQDLVGFWQNAYQAVKKEMKGRYPKHPWPDDPLAALPTHKVKAQLA